MLDKVEEIKKCLQNNLFLSALTLTLTLPDICGKIEYPDLKSGRRYKQWYREWVSNDINTLKNMKCVESYLNEPTINADLCYALRCELLHAGTTDVEDSRLNKYYKDFIFNFELITSGLTKQSITWYNDDEHKNICIQLNVIDFCNEICASVQMFYNSKDKECFTTSNVRFKNNNTAIR